MVTARGLVLLIATAFVVALGCGKQGSDAPKDKLPPAPSSDAKPTGPFAKRAAQVNVAKTEPVLSTDAASWKKQCEEDEEGTKKKYLGKVVQITGTVVGMERYPEEKVARVYVGMMTRGCNACCSTQNPG
jgi:hypothetical protein